MSNKKIRNKWLGFLAKNVLLINLNFAMMVLDIILVKVRRKKWNSLLIIISWKNLNGGKATIENGALLSLENHEWFNKQSDKHKEIRNRKFQNYKQCKVVFVDDLQLDVQIKAIIFQPEISKKKKYHSIWLK